MPAEDDRPPASEDTVVLDGDDVTLADEEWPVAEQYRVGLRDDRAARRPPLVTTTSSGPASRRQFPPDLGPGLLLALLAALVIIGLAAFLTTRGDEGDTPPATQASETTTDPTDTMTEPPSAETTPAADVIPDVGGMPLAEARSTLERAGLGVRVRRSASDRPAGEVLRQAPPAGGEVELGTVVVLTVAGTPKKPPPRLAAVPGIMGFSSSDAVVTLRDAGFVPQIRLVDSSQPTGTVVRQIPVEGAELARGGTVRLDVSGGRPRATAPVSPTVDVPRLVGMTVSDARRELRALGLRSTAVEVAGEQPAGTVLGQSPRAGAELREGGTVTLRVSRGPVTVAIPDVTGLDEASARLELESAGFEVRIDRRADGRSGSGRHRSSSIARGRHERRGGRRGHAHDRALRLIRVLHGRAPR